MTYQILERTQTLISLIQLWKQTNTLMNRLVAHRLNVRNNYLLSSVWQLCFVKMPLQQCCVWCGSHETHNAGLKRPQLSIVTYRAPWKKKLLTFTNHIFWCPQRFLYMQTTNNGKLFNFPSHCCLKACLRQSKLSRLLLTSRWILMDKFENCCCLQVCCWEKSQWSLIILEEVISLDVDTH